MRFLNAYEHNRYKIYDWYVENSYLLSFLFFNGKAGVSFALCNELKSIDIIIITTILLLSFIDAITVFPKRWKITFIETDGHFIYGIFLNSNSYVLKISWILVIKYFSIGTFLLFPDYTSPTLLSSCYNFTLKKKVLLEMCYWR